MTYQGKKRFLEHESVGVKMKAGTGIDGGMEKLHLRQTQLGNEAGFLV